VRDGYWVSVNVLITGNGLTPLRVWNSNGLGAQVDLRDGFDGTSREMAVRFVTARLMRKSGFGKPDGKGE
jgi:hypothetical protein